MGDEPRIEITENGPYVVRGGPPIVRTAQVETELGEPIDWAPEKAVEAPDPVELCRCGASTSMPFCDHEGCVGFDGTETADRGPFIDRAYAYEGFGFTMPDDRSLCTHSGYCGDVKTTVWAMLAESDDPEVRGRLRRMVQLCPSGRIVYVPDGGEPDEIDYGKTVALIQDGPIWARGSIRIEAADGTPYEPRNRVTLCRCGGSTNKPFCDGTHKEVGFREG